MKDIDQIIQEISRRYKDVHVEQLKATHPADDDGVWFFSLPDVNNEVQVESCSGRCPFNISDNYTKKSLTAATVQDAVSKIEILFKNAGRK